MTIPTDSNLINQYVGAATFSATQGTQGGARAGGGSGANSGSWYEAMSRAWGNTLDAQANEITSLSDAISAGDDQPSQMVALTAASLKMNFMSNNAATSQNSVAEALTAVARKQ